MPSEAVPVSSFQQTMALFEGGCEDADSAMQPLRINKSTPTSSPFKANGTAVTQRPLAEISPMERRRNSPSYNQATKVGDNVTLHSNASYANAVQKMILSRESSPFDSSPYGNSPRAFWQGRDPTSPSRFSSENIFDREQSPSAVKRRTSLEKLMQASRVKNSAMFAREQKNEYDPTSVPVVERPLAAGRPLGTQVQGNAFGGRGLEGQRESTGFRGHKRGESQTKIPLFSPSMPSTTSPPAEKSPSPLPSREQPSPTKSSMSSNPNHNTFPRRFDPNSAAWDDDEDEVTIEPPRALRRQAKSVTFDTAPPEINEYEMVTPDPSSVASGSREGSYEDEDEDEEIDLDQAEQDREDSFDASLEDTDKTPVVLPEDWRHMSPETANTQLADTFEDPFEPDHRLTPSKAQHSGSRRSDSLNSDGSHRPLPALPNGIPHRESNGLSAAAERVHSAHRSLPSPPRGAQISKSDILGMKHSKMSLEERLRLMGISDSANDAPQDTAAKEAARLRKHGLGIHLQDEQKDFTDDSPFPRISRESILRKVKSRSFEASSERRYNVANLDPDVPLPSREGSEASSHFDDIPSDVHIKQEDDDEPIDVYSIPELYSAEPEDAEQQLARGGSVIRRNIDAGSYYSPESATAGAQQTSNSSTEDEGPPTPKGNEGPGASNPHAQKAAAGNPQEFSSLLDDADFQAGLGSYMSQSSTPPPPPVEKDPKPDTMSSVRRFFHRETTPEEEQARPVSAPEFGHEDDRSDTPGSVVHHPIDDEEERESPFVPAPVATIKAPGGRLKTRPSVTPADMASMAAARRQVSGQMPPPIPEKSPRRYSKSLEPEDADQENSNVSEESRDKRRETFSNIKLDLGEEALGEDLSLGLEKDFERVIESSKVDYYSYFQHHDPESGSQGAISEHEHAHSMGAEHTCGQAFSPQKSPTNPYLRTQKGYLMRQNTKVVVAKRDFSNETSSDGRPSSAHEMGSKSVPSSPRKPSHERAKSWTTEPWNGKIRRKSVRQGSVSKRPMSGPVPPLPGQESAVTGGLEALHEDKQAMFGDDEQEGGIERGRLFVKVVGVKDLDLPLPHYEPTYFQLTLDNGLHCVTTSWLELGHTAPIGQEFELVVLNDLEFQLTLQTKLTPPPKPTAILSNPFKSSTNKSPSKKTSFRSLFSSPTKRREKEQLAARKAAEEEQARIAEHERAASRAAATATPTAWDLLHELVGEDGSFGRAYVCLKNHERHCYGRQISVDMAVFNEWALEDASIVSSVKSKNGGAVTRRPPYEVGKLTLQMLYVPRPRGSREEEMPKSMNGAMREMGAAEEGEVRAWEGFLSQQGGDCPVSSVSSSFVVGESDANVFIVLAPPLLPPQRHQAYRLPRNDPPTTRGHRTLQSRQAHRRQDLARAARCPLQRRQVSSQVCLR